MSQTKFVLNAREYREYKEVMKRNQSLEIEIKDLIRQVSEFKDKEKNQENELKKLIQDTQLIKESSLAKEKELEELIKSEQEKEKTTRGQKILLLEFLGTLDTIEGLKIHKGNKIKLLTYIVEATEKSVEQDYNVRTYHINSRLSNISNYTFLVDVCKKLGIKEFEEKAENMLQKIEKRDSEK